LRHLTALLLVCLALGCAPKAKPVSQDRPACTSADTPRLFRHVVRLHIAGRNQDLSLEGMMRLETDHTARIIGMGAFGLRMFDITVTPDQVETNFLNPGMKSIPRLTEHIAFCVRRIWLGFQPGPGDSACGPDDGQARCGNCGPVQLRHVFSRGRLMRTQASGPGEAWSIEYSGHDERSGEPGQITFRDGKGRFELDIRQFSQGAKP